jgi:PAS domain S-box-containing protein
LNAEPAATSRGTSPGPAAGAAASADARHWHEVMFDNAFDSLFVTDGRSRIVDWNPASERLFGYTKREMIGQSPEMLNVPGEGHRTTQVIQAALIRQGRWSGRLRFVRKCGSVGVCEALVLRPISAEKGTISINRDLTERMQIEKQAERHRTELSYMTRLNTLGGMVAMLAHELNQPLSAIVNYAEGCVNHLNAPASRLEDILEAMDRISMQAERAARVVTRIREFVHTRNLRRTRFAINDLLHKIVDFLQLELERGGVTLDLQLADELPLLHADSIQIEQVVLNLMLNSIEAMVSTPTRQRKIIIRSELAGSKAILVSVRDAGKGIPAAVAARIFEPLFSTKEGGMGMGLSISQTIIAAHGGHIWAVPAFPSGTEMQFSIPIRGLIGE